MASESRGKQHATSGTNRLTDAIISGKDNDMNSQIRSLLSLNDHDKVVMVNTRDVGGRTCLHYAALHGRPVETIRALLLAKANANLQDGQGQTALHLALKERYMDCAALLLQQPSIDVTKADAFSRLPLHWAAQAGYDRLIGQCLRGSSSSIATVPPLVSVNSRTQSGDTALHWAVSEGSVSTVRALLSEGAAVDICNDRGVSPLAWATSKDTTASGSSSSSSNSSSSSSSSSNASAIRTLMLAAASLSSTESSTNNAVDSVSFQPAPAVAAVSIASAQWPASTSSAAKSDGTKSDGTKSDGTKSDGTKSDGRQRPRMVIKMKTRSQA